MRDRLCAAVIFFTRLPLWRVVTPPHEAYRRVVDLWPLAGWVTGGVTAAVLYAASLVFPAPAAVAVALAARAILTGGLHEDGLADWWDAMGGGHDRDRILAIMKDSHIGTYGVMSLVFYYLLAVTMLSGFAAPAACAVVFAADAWSKCCASQIINRLPYARTEQTAKNRTVYDRMPAGARILNLILGIFPCLLLPWGLLPALLAPVAVTWLAIRTMRGAIGGYTGDCCGATALMCELGFYAAALICQKII